MIYELWDVDTANLIDSFDHEEPALQVVRTMVDEHGRGSIDFWSLTEKHLQTGETRVLAHGKELADRAFLTPA